MPPGLTPIQLCEPFPVSSVSCGTRFFFATVGAGGDQVLYSIRIWQNRELPAAEDECGLVRREQGGHFVTLFPSIVTAPAFTSRRASVLEGASPPGTSISTTVF